MSDGDIEDHISKRPFHAYDGDRDYIFVSYAHIDARFVFPVIERFHNRGHPIWYDQGLTPGQEWDDEVADALINSSLLVVFVSSNSMASSNVQDEIKLALKREIPIVPIFLEKTVLPSGLELRLSNKQSIFKFSMSDDEFYYQCFKSFDNFDVPIIDDFTSEENVSITRNLALDDALNEFNEMNTTTFSFFDLGNLDVLIILKDGSNLTSWHEVEDKGDIIYVSEDLSGKDYVTARYKDLENVKVIVAQGVTSEVSETIAVFENCKNLIKVFGFNTWDVSNVSRMVNMFFNCHMLNDISGLDEWDVSNVALMGGMFNRCYNLTDISPMSKWKTSNLENINGMFRSCSSLVSLDAVGNWDVSKISNLNAVFAGCKSLEDISALEKWDVSNITSMESLLETAHHLKSFPDWAAGIRLTLNL